MSFRQLLDDLARERDRRAYDRDVAMTVDRIRFGGRPFHKAMSSLTGELKVMAKAMTVDLAQTRAAQRQDAIDIWPGSTPGRRLGRVGPVVGAKKARSSTAPSRARPIGSAGYDPDQAPVRGRASEHDRRG